MLNRDQVIAKLEALRSQIPSLKESHFGAPEFERWHRNTDVAIRHIFGDPSRHLVEFLHVQFRPPRTITTSYGSIGGPSIFERGLQKADTLLQSMIDEVSDYGVRGERSSTSSVSGAGYVDPTRLAELRAITSPQYDLSRLIRLCEELNVCYAGECYQAVAMLVRALLDHVPPIFSCNTFGDVASQYPGSRSFKDQMQHLQQSQRKIADMQLHSHIRRRETLPTRTQVNFAPALDVLLGEIVTILR